MRCSGRDPSPGSRPPSGASASSLFADTFLILYRIHPLPADTHTLQSNPQRSFAMTKVFSPLKTSLAAIVWRMRLSLSLCAVLCLALLLPPCAQATTPVTPLHTSGASIVDADGNRAHLYTFNWYGTESSDFVVAGLQTATLANIVQTIKSMGFTAARLPWSNEMYESNPVVDSSKLTANPSLQGKTALAIFDQVVSALTDAGIMVILDNHNSNAEWCCGNDGNTLWYNSSYPESSWISDWTGMVTRYASNSMVIGADLRNEPRLTATWGGDSSTDWHAAAQRGGNAILAVNSNLLIFVEGINYSLDFSSVAANPIQLNVANRLVYAPHEYGYDYSSLTTYTSYATQVDNNWGGLISGTNPTPLWLGEFGTCNTADSCISSTSSSNNGLWFSYLTTYLQQHDIDWAYWAINGTESTGSSRTWGSAESYGILNTAWSGSASSTLSARLATMISATSGISLFSAGNISITAPGQSGSSSIAIVPQNGFTGTVSLSCAVTSVSSSSTTTTLPTCTVPSSISIANQQAATATVTVATTSATSRNLIPSSFKKKGSLVALGFLGLFLLPRRARYSHFYRRLACCVLLFLSLGGCSSGSSSSSSSSSSGTATGDYNVTVTATSGSTTSNIKLVVVVE